MNKILVFKLNITKGINIYQYLNLSNLISKKISKYGLNIRSPHTQMYKKVKKYTKKKDKTATRKKKKLLQDFFKYDAVLKGWTTEQAKLEKELGEV